MPDLYIIAGPNGAGKSTASTHYLPAAIREKYVSFDSDKLKRAKQREFYLQVKSYKEAGKMADEFVDSEFNRQYKAALGTKTILCMKDILQRILAGNSPNVSRQKDTK